MSDHTYYPAYRCPTHGPVVGYTPFDYREGSGSGYRFGPFCPLCIGEWYGRTFLRLNPEPLAKLASAGTEEPEAGNAAPNVD